MKKTPAYLILTLFLAFSLGCGNSQTSCLPTALTGGTKLCLGVKQQTLVDSLDLRYDNSLSCYVGHLHSNPYFSDIYLNEEQGMKLLQSSYVESIMLEGHINDPNFNADRLAKEVIDICINNFGSNYAIVDGGYENAEPVLIWRQSKYYVSFEYIPRILYEQLAAGQKYVPTGFRLVFGRFNREIARTMKKPSTVWTKENLGL